MRGMRGMVAAAAMLGIVGIAPLPVDQSAVAYEHTGCSFRGPYEWDVRSVSSADDLAWRKALVDVASTDAHFMPADVPSTATVTLTTDHYGNTSWDGYAKWFNCTTSATAFTNRDYTHSYTNLKKQALAAHEIGHTVGLGHETGCVIMNGSSRTRSNVCGLVKLTSDDRRGTNALS